MLPGPQLDRVIALVQRLSRAPGANIRSAVWLVKRLLNQPEYEWMPGDGMNDA